MRLQRTLRTLCCALGGAAIWGATQPAEAQEQGLALNRFDPAPAGDRMFGVQSPFSAGHLTPHVMLLADYAHNPLVLRTLRTDQDLGAIVSNQLFLHINGSFSLWNRLNINLDAPIALVQSGDSPSQSPLASPSGAQFGDLRLGLRFRIWGDYHDAFQVAVGGYVWLPTGATGAFVSDESARGMPQLIVGGRTDRLVWSFAAGPEIRGGQTFANVTQGTMLKFGAGAGVLLGDTRRLQIGPEINVAMVLEDVNTRTTNSELLLGARYRVVPDVELGLGVGPGLSSGIGTPDVRGLAMLAYTPEQKPPGVPPPPDRDGDGIPDSVDACPEVKGVLSTDPKKNGCPPDSDGDGIIDTEDACPSVVGVKNDDPKKNGCPPDRDGDGIIDAEDACPDVAGVKNDDPKKNGCPPDRDDDGIPDAEDACPDLKGVKSTDPAQNGCPPDTDGDTIRDDKDACPNEKGVADPDPEKNGCPKAVRVTEQEIVILQQVQFDTAKATIKPVSNELLDEVAGVLKEHPELTKLEVQGHTDDRGPKKLNEKLSDDRAKAVVKALVARGIDENRLIAKGYGPNKPIADNKTAEGRQKNRRVQFVILEKKSKEEAKK